jgi:NAD+ synthase (glutamine-hydrolysing)
MRIALAQINTTVGDFEGNTRKITDSIEEARSLGTDIVVFPELAICGYPPEDLLFKPQFIQENVDCLNQIVGQSHDIVVIVGFVDQKEDIYNAAAIIHDQKIDGIYHKIYLPNYGVFDENRYFQSGNECPIYIIGGCGVGINICEDIWYDNGPITVQSMSGAQLIINISASPYYAGRSDYRERMIGTRASDNVAIVALCNLVGGQDELVFDGNSIIIDEKGRLIAHGKQFEEELVVADIDVKSPFQSRLHDSRWRKETNSTETKKWHITKTIISETLPDTKKPTLAIRQNDNYDLPGEIYKALVLGTRDYITKNSFQKVVIGFSGGIDSSLVALIAVDALGASNVIGVAMPTRYSSPQSITDAEQLARNLGVKFITVPIDSVFQEFLDILADSFDGAKPDITEENIQARVRGTILMALSNKFGWLVLTTGNKSEMATGYSTLYGDMAGGFAVIKDVPKTLVYQLANYRNSIAGKEIIPGTIISKEPSAELRPDQKDTDSLPPYDILDPIITAYAEEDKSIEQIITMGFDVDVVKRTAKLVDRSEYKRRQSPPGIKITPRAFGRDRRLPITNRFKAY